MKWKIFCKLFGHIVYIKNVTRKKNKFIIEYTNKCYRKGCKHKMDYSKDKFQVET